MRGRGWGSPSARQRDTDTRPGSRKSSPCDQLAQPVAGRAGRTGRRVVRGELRDRLGGRYSQVAWEATT